MNSREEIQNWITSKEKELHRPLGSTAILAVSKLQPTSKIKELHSSGQMDFGENYVQEALTKIEDLKSLHLRWHFIGHLQKNKVKTVTGVFELIHSIDSVSLAEKVNTRASDLGVKQKVLLEINQAHEKTKTGFQAETLGDAWPKLKELKSLQICGLMCLPPISEDPEKSRPYFRRLRDQLESLRKNTDLSIHPLNHLSMGTSHDYKVAVEEGSTILRLGTILFGQRPVQAKGKL